LVGLKSTSLQQLTFHANSEELHLELEFRLSTYSNLTKEIPYKSNHEKVIYKNGKEKFNLRFAKATSTWLLFFQVEVHRNNLHFPETENPWSKWSRVNRRFSQISYNLQELRFGWG